MIRFSAALVAVAIGVLIGGIATSKLLLVYIAIVVSAVALVALAIGVVLKREELFGETRGAAPAQPASAGPVLSARAGDSDDRNRPNGQVPPAALQGMAVGPGVAFAGYGQAASPQPGATQPGATQPGATQPGEAWETTWTGRDAWPAPVTATSFSAAGQTPSAARAPAAGWGTPATGESPAGDGPAAQGNSTESGPESAPAPSVFAPRSADLSAAGPGAGRPGWFSPSDRAASAGAPAPQARPAWSWLNDGTGAAGDDGQEHGGKPGGSAAVDEDDDWPARYSWLNDEPEEGGKAGGGAEASAPATGVPAAGAGQDDLLPAAPGTPSAARTPDAAPADAAPAEAAPAEAADDPGEKAGPAASAGDAGPATLPVIPETEDGSPSTAAAAEAPLVIVLPGVPRFHQPDCVLIRFMPDDDTQKMSVAQAEEAGCTPCAACQPEG